MMAVRPNIEVVADRHVLGRFAVSPAFSVGDFATVHHASLVGDDGSAPFIVKKLLPALRADPESRALLLASGKLGLSLDSRHCVSTVEVGEHPEPYVVMRAVDGVSLDRLLAYAPRRGATRHVIPLFVDALRGLHALHQLPASDGTPGGFVHSAPAARHLLVDAQGRGVLAGLTHVVGPGIAWSATRDERLQPREMAPEQVLSPSHVDPRSDLFVLTASLWQALTGRALFDGNSRDAILRSVLRASFVPPSEAGAAVGRVLDPVLRRALRRNRAERYESAEQMAGDLERRATAAGLFASRAEIASWAQTYRAQAVGGPRPAPVLRTTSLGLGPTELPAPTHPSLELGAPALSLGRDDEEPALNVWDMHEQPPARGARLRIAGLALAGLGVVGTALALLAHSYEVDSASIEGAPALVFQASREFALGLRDSVMADETNEPTVPSKEERTNSSSGPASTPSGEHPAVRVSQQAADTAASAPSADALANARPDVATPEPRVAEPAAREPAVAVEHRAGDVEREAAPSAKPPRAAHDRSGASKPRHANASAPAARKADARGAASHPVHEQPKAGVPAQEWSAHQTPYQSSMQVPSSRAPQRTPAAKSAAEDLPDNPY